MKIHYFKCPHCDLICQVPENEIRCKIFRHAVFKENMKFADPHASKEVCDSWVKEGKIYGCGKPFKFDGNKVEKCGYI